MSPEPSLPVQQPALFAPPVAQADRHLLALHALRQRQIRTSFLHGRRRTWRDRRRIWPAVIFALVVIALLIAGTSVVEAFQRQQQVDGNAAQPSMVQFSNALVGTMPGPRRGDSKGPPTE